jgi:hypothetical protein
MIQLQPFILFLTQSNVKNTPHAVLFMLIIDNGGLGKAVQCWEEKDLMVLLVVDLW